MDKKKSTNNVIIGLLIALIVAVLCVGGYFIIKDITKSQNPESSQNDSNSGTNDSSKNNSQKDDASGNTPTPEPAPVQDEIEAGITYSEIRGNDYYIEVQTNGAISGTCEISMVPTNGGQGHHETDDLDVQNKVSICDEDFSLKGLNRGEHKITVVIRASDGRTKTLEQIVNL